MGVVLENYYKDHGINPILLKQKISMFDRNKDIAAEFEYWIEHGEYSIGGCEVEGYSAKILGETFNKLKGEGSFILMIELRENPNKARNRISRGFKEL